MQRFLPLEVIQGTTICLTVLLSDDASKVQQVGSIDIFDRLFYYVLERRLIRPLRSHSLVTRRRCF